MTQWQPFPLRPPNQPWPGLNTRGGKLDDGRGWLEDGSINAIINEADLLEKRPGFVRGLNERFDEVVCGLFTYLDDCGREWLLVADRSGISIRQPFDIPVFETSDAYPIDSFEAATIDPVDWRNSAIYTTVGGSLTCDEPAIDATSFPGTRLMRWFKPASSSSYQVTIQHLLGTAGSVAVAIKGVDTLDGTARIWASVTSTKLILAVVGANGSELARHVVPVSGSGGFLKLAYDAEARVATVTATPTGGTIVTLSTDPLTVVQDAGLGQVSAIGVGHPDAGILQVSSGPL